MLLVLELLKLVKLKDSALVNYEARTQHLGRWTRVRRGDVQATSLPKRLCRVPFFFGMIHADTAPIRPESVRIKHNHQYRRELTDVAEIKKKKK